MPPEEGLHYQPIPFPGFESMAAERDGSPARLDMLASQLEFGGRRVLDLGCANGFFLFSLAQADPPIAAGLGVDHFHGNVAGNQALAAAFGFDELAFRQASIDESLLDEVLAESWDVVLLLSVHHHLARSLGIDATKRVIERLLQAAPVVVIEQGSLTQDEYNAWTGRDEPFDTRAFSRLISMLEACGAASTRCRPIGEGLYLSGRRPDAAGSGRAIVAHLRDGADDAGVLEIQRKRHRNGVYMELLELVQGPSGSPELWKNVVTGPSLAARERRALAHVRETGWVPRVLDDAASEPDPHLIRLARHALVRVAELDETARERAASQLREALLAFASCGVVHHELSAEHVQWDADTERLVVLDWETARFSSEPFAAWRETVADPNPALGLDMYPRELLDSEPDRCDLVAANGLLQAWGQVPLGEDFERSYLESLSQGDES